MTMIDLYFSIEELELLEDTLLTILTYNNQGKLPVRYNDKDISVIEDARNQMLEALKSKGKDNDN